MNSVSVMWVVRWLRVISVVLAILLTAALAAMVMIAAVARTGQVGLGQAAAALMTGGLLAATGLKIAHDFRGNWHD